MHASFRTLGVEKLTGPEDPDEINDEEIDGVLDVLEVNGFHRGVHVAKGK